MGNTCRLVRSSMLQGFSQRARLEGVNERGAQCLMVSLCVKDFATVAPELGCKQGTCLDVDLAFFSRTIDRVAERASSKCISAKADPYFCESRGSTPGATTTPLHGPLHLPDPLFHSACLPERCLQRGGNLRQVPLPPPSIFHTPMLIAYRQPFSGRAKERQARPVPGEPSITSTTLF